jgi:hypothetical protein
MIHEIVVMTYQKIFDCEDGNIHSTSSPPADNAANLKQDLNNIENSSDADGDDGGDDKDMLNQGKREDNDDEGSTSSNVTSPLREDEIVPINDRDYNDYSVNGHAPKDDCEDMLDKADGAAKTTRKRLAGCDNDYDPNKKARIVELTPEAIKLPNQRRKKPRKIRKTPQLKRNMPSEQQDVFEYPKPDITFPNSDSKSALLLPASEAMPSIADPEVEPTLKAVCQNEGKFKCSDHVTCHKH